MEDEETEDILVYVQCESENMSTVTNLDNFKIIGIDTDKPIMALNGKYYEGNYEHAVGTYLFFDSVKTPEESDPFQAIPSVRYFAKTRKVLQMQRVFINPTTSNPEKAGPVQTQATNSNSSTRHSEKVFAVTNRVNPSSLPSNIPQTQ